MDIRRATCIIIRKDGEYLIGTICYSKDLRWSGSPYGRMADAEEGRRGAGGPEGWRRNGAVQSDRETDEGDLMIKREKVIKGLECCTLHDQYDTYGYEKFRGIGKCGGCPYYGYDCTRRMHEDILALLKDQEAVEQKTTQKDGYNLQELWKRSRAGETLNETELNFLLADWDERNIFKPQEEGR